MFASLLGGSGGSGSVLQQRIAALQSGGIKGLLATIGTRFGQVSQPGGTLQATISGPTTVSPGTTATFTVTASGGTAPYTYQFYSTVSGTQSGSAYTVTPSATGTESIFADVTDAVGDVVTTLTISYTVAAGTGTALNATISGPTTVSPGTTATVTVTASGGTAPYTYQFYSTVLGTQSGSAYTVTPSATGTESIFADVTDAVGDVVTTLTISYTVAAGTGTALNATISGPTTVSPGTTATVTVTASGGTGPYSYVFTSSVVGVQNGNVYTVMPSAAGTETISCVVSDSIGDSTGVGTAYTVTAPTAPTGFNVTVGSDSIRPNLLAVDGAAATGTMNLAVGTHNVSTPETVVSTTGGVATPIGVFGIIGAVGGGGNTTITQTFAGWTTTGGVTVADKTSASTTMTVTGAGGITAVYTETTTTS